jgi:dienelactone hydrolase
MNSMPDEANQQQVFHLYDDYCHGRIERREFFSRSAAMTIGGVSALALAESMLPKYAETMTVSFTDERIKATWVDYDSPGGNSGRMRGYLVAPKGEGPFPSVQVIHENRGLNPYVKDVSRCAATEGFLALAPDRLVPVGGYPGNDDDGRSLQIHYAENDNWVNGTRQDYEAGLQASGLPFEMHTYPGTGHGLHNNSTPRYVEAASDLAWQRTMAWFHRYL